MPFINIINLHTVFFLFPTDISAINITVLDHVFCQNEQIKATFCIHCGSDFPDSVAVSIVKGENHSNGEDQMLCVPERNGSQEYQQIPLKQYSQYF